MPVLWQCSSYKLKHNKMHLLQYLKSIVLLFSLSLISFNLSANEVNYQQSKSYFEHLSAINKEWKYFEQAAPKGKISFASDLDRIQLHLNLVIEHLKLNIPKEFNADQKSKRLTLLVKLQEYADQKTFPINQFHSIRTPYFVDHLGTNCAVGQMIYVSGHEDLVAKISREHNYDYIKDIKTKGVVEWANEYGFTLNELKWIQPAYAPTQTMDQVLNGTNGRVKKITPHPWGTKLFIAGEFTELDDLPCLNIGVYENNQLTCLGSGVDGIINDIVPTLDGVYIVGEFEHNGEFYPVARYEDSLWSYFSIPGRANAIGMAANSEGFDYFAYDLEIAIAHSSIPNQQEVWHWLDDGSWSKRMLMNGEVNDFATSHAGRIHAGHFDTVTVFKHSGEIDTIMKVNNVIIRNNSYSAPYYRIGDEISNEVNAVLNIAGTVYFAGKCDAYDGNNIICISRYQNSVLQPVFLNQVSEFEFNIKSIAYDGDRTLALGGDFNKSSSWVYGDNLATFDLINNGFMPIAVLDKPVNSVQYFDGELYAGGDFRTNLSTDSINFLGRVASTVGLNEEPTIKVNITVFPNPFDNVINVEGIEDGTKYSIIHLDGRIVKENHLKNGKISDLELLPKGTYLLNFETLNGSIIRKVVK